MSRPRQHHRIIATTLIAALLVLLSAWLPVSADYLPTQSMSSSSSVDCGTDRCSSEHASLTLNHCDHHLYNCELQCSLAVNIPLPNTLPILPIISGSEAIHFSMPHHSIPQPEAALRPPIAFNVKA